MRYISVTANDVDTIIKNGQKYKLNTDSDVKITKVESYSPAFSNISVLAKCNQWCSIKKEKTFIANAKGKYLILEDRNIFWVRNNYLYTYSYDFKKYTFTKLEDLLYDLTEYGVLVPVQENEATVVAFLHIWDSQSSSKGMPKNLCDYALKLKVPSAWKKCSKTLYRGIRLSDKDLYAVQKGGSINLEPKSVTSWTTDKSVAENFILNFGDSGVVISENPAKLDIIVNTNKIKYLPDYVLDEQEVLVKGNGIDTITKKNILKIIK